MILKTSKKKKNLGYRIWPHRDILTIYAPMIYTAPCVRSLIWADRLRGAFSGGLNTIYAPMIYTAPFVRSLIWADRLRGAFSGGLDIDSLILSLENTPYLFRKKKHIPHFLHLRYNIPVTIHCFTARDNIVSSNRWLLLSQENTSPPPKSKHGFVDQSHLHPLHRASERVVSQPGIEPGTSCTACEHSMQRANRTAYLVAIRDLS